MRKPFHHRSRGPSWTNRGQGGASFLQLETNSGRLANSDWLDDLSESGFDIDGAALVNHAFWSPTAEARDQFAESFSGAGFVVISASDSGTPGRWECIVEHRLERLADEIDAVTADLENRALSGDATYDGWDIRR